MLSRRLSDKIDTVIASLKIPTIYEIDEAEIAEIVPALTDDDVVEDPSVITTSDTSELSVSSTLSDDDNPTTSMMKKMFKETDSDIKADLIERIVNLSSKKEKQEDYKDWSTKHLEKKLQQLNTIIIKQQPVEKTNHED